MSPTRSRVFVVPAVLPHGRKRKADAVAPTHGDAEFVTLALGLREYEGANDSSQLAKLLDVARTYAWPTTVVQDAASFRACVARVKLLDEAMS